MRRATNDRIGSLGARCRGKIRSRPVQNLIDLFGSHDPLFLGCPNYRADTRTKAGANAVVLPRKNAKPWKPGTAGAIARNETLRASKYLGRALWRKWSGYHRRSRAETKMHCMKRLGQKPMARDPDRQVAELQLRVVVVTRFTVLGKPVTVALG